MVYLEHRNLSLTCHSANEKIAKGQKEKEKKWSGHESVGRGLKMRGSQNRIRLGRHNHMDKLCEQYERQIGFSGELMEVRNYAVQQQRFRVSKDQIPP